MFFSENLFENTIDFFTVNDAVVNESDIAGVRMCSNDNFGVLYLFD